MVSFDERIPKRCRRENHWKKLHQRIE
jgi:hypothetical protein